MRLQTKTCVLVEDFDTLTAHIPNCISTLHRVEKIGVHPCSWKLTRQKILVTLVNLECRNFATGELIMKKQNCILVDFLFDVRVVITVKCGSLLLFGFARKKKCVRRRSLHNRTMSGRDAVGKRELSIRTPLLSMQTMAGSNTTSTH